MDIIYNELSEIYPSETKALADERMHILINAYIQARKSNIKKIRFAVSLEDIEIAQNYFIKNWLEETSNKNHKNLLLAARDYPEWNRDDNWYGETYSMSTFTFVDEANQIPQKKSYGLAAAHLYDTLSISLSGRPAWEKNTLNLTKTTDETGEAIVLPISNVFSEKCFENDSVRHCIENNGDVVLVESLLSYNEKKIHFRDDHGTDDLMRFAKKLVQSPYVNEVINSIEWKSNETKFIKGAFADGIIHIRLHWDDRGLGLAIKTTGRNLRETIAIGENLREKYDR